MAENAIIEEVLTANSEYQNKHFGPAKMKSKMVIPLDSYSCGPAYIATTVDLCEA